MSNPNNIDPLEGKGEEMIPEKGLPFDDIDETPLEDIPPEERIPDFPQDEPVNITSERDLIPEEEPEAEPSFELSEAEAEAIIGDVDGSFELEASPWTMDDDEIDAFIGESSEVFTPTDVFDMPIEDVGAPIDKEEILLEDEFDPPPEDYGDEGMSTHREDLPEDMVMDAQHEAYFSEFASQPPGTAMHETVHTHDDITHAGQAAMKPMIDLLVTDEAMENLWRRAAQAQKDVNRHIKTVYIAQALLDQIQAGRNELMAGKEYFEEAERHIAEAEYRVQHSIQLEKWSKSLIPKLFIYLAVWFVALTSATIYMLISGNDIFSADTGNLFKFAGSMIFGGVGGIVGALLPLIKHFSEEQDFSDRHVWWYYASPFIGVGMGFIIFVFVSAGAFSLSAGSGTISSPYLLYILAGLAGYQHNVFTDLVKRMLKVLEIDKKDKIEPPPTPDNPPSDHS